jgi:aromatic-L-amino-acid/L-tryptophan decarboxylase
MNISDFRRHAHEMADYIANYLEDIDSLPVKSLKKPGEIFNALPLSPPDDAEPFDKLMYDFNHIILPGITHWQSPGFFAYFPANSSYPSVLAEMLTAAMGAQCMVWETSPAAAELEEKVMEWLKQMTGIPANFHGVIQDTASTSTLVALLTAREKHTSFQINESGFNHNNFRIYCSTEAHSSVEKAVKIAGFGRKNLVKIDVDENQSLNPEALEAAIKTDIQKGLTPLFVVVAIGTTGTAAIDPLKPVSLICSRMNIWLHVDAAYAGTAMLLPEYRHLLNGIEDADSYVFNPHKWMFTNFDCSAYFVKDRNALINTFEILPEYLKTKSDNQVNNYRDWGIQLGRRFRALKLWFVIRSMGVDNMRKTIHNHIIWANWIAEQIKKSENFELIEPQHFSLVCFRLKPINIIDNEILNILNQKFLFHLNATGKLYLSHTKVNNTYVLRLLAGQTYLQFEHVKNAWEFIHRESQQFI